MRLKSIIAPLVFSACVLPFLLPASVASAEDLQLQDNHPDRYTVQKGDTLWGISAKFLKQPWRWPEIWRMNREQIKNPNLIYPGDVIALDKVNGEWRLSLARGGRDSGPRGDVRLSPSIRVEPLDAEAIPSIPPGDIAPYLSLPLVTDADGIPGAGKIIAARDGRVVRGVGDFVYAINVDEKSGTQWYIYRPGKILYSFDSNEKLGY
jgi:LysM domain